MKITQMTITRTLTLGALAAAAAFGQMTGSITITGSIPESISMTDTSNGLLGPTLVLGALTAANVDTLTKLAVPVDVRIRSNRKFKLNAVAVLTNSGPGSDDGGQPINAKDIGFGITAKGVGGAHVGTVRGLDAISGLFDYTVTAIDALPVTNGRTPFVVGTNGTLNDISAAGGTQVMAGNRVSDGGNINSTDNFMLLSFNVATLPQYFTPTTAFQAVITLTPVLM